MAEPEKNLDKLREEQEKDDSDILADLDKSSKEFDKARLPHTMTRAILMMYRTPRSTA